MLQGRQGGIRGVYHSLTLLRIIDLLFLKHTAIPVTNPAIDLRLKNGKVGYLDKARQVS